MQKILTRHATLIRVVSAVLILASAMLLIRGLPVQRAMEAAQQWIDSLGPWGPLAFAAFYVVAVLLLIPGSILTLMAGAVYGLLLGTVVVWFSATTAAALAFLIARHAAREKVLRRLQQSPQLSAVDRAIGEHGWKIVALLRLSPAIPFGLQNYLYGVTALRFWPCVLASWLAMLPGTFLYIYAGSLGKAAVSGDQTSTAEWVARGIGLAATLAVSVYIAKVARSAIENRTEIEDPQQSSDRASNRTRQDASRADAPPNDLFWPWSTMLISVIAVSLAGLALWVSVLSNGG